MEFTIYAGRLNRARYFWSFWLTVILTNIILMAIVSGSSGGRDEDAAAVVVFVLWLLQVCVLSVFIVKRLHDLNRSGGHFWLLLVPLYNVYLILALLFQRGAEGPNRFGDDPLASVGQAPGDPAGGRPA